MSDLRTADITICELNAKNNELETLRAKLAKVEGERDAWKEQFEISADPDGDYREYCSNIMYDLQRERDEAIAAGWYHACKANDAEQERDEARRWAAALSRSVRMWRFMAHDYAAAMTRKHAVELYLTAKQNLIDPNGWHIVRGANNDD